MSNILSTKTFTAAESYILPYNPNINIAKSLKFDENWENLVEKANKNWRLIADFILKEDGTYFKQSLNEINTHSLKFLPDLSTSNSKKYRVKRGFTYKNLSFVKQRKLRNKYYETFEEQTVKKTTLRKSTTTDLRQSETVCKQKAKMQRFNERLLQPIRIASRCRAESITDQDVSVAFFLSSNDSLGNTI